MAKEITDNSENNEVEVIETKPLKNILILEDVPKFIGLDEAFPVCDLGVIHAMELSEFLECIGLKLKENMCLCLADYSDQITWDDTTEIKEGQAVEYCGDLFIAIKDSVCITPPNVEYYKPATRFDHSKPCGKIYEEFYCKYLGPYLANCLLVKQIPKLHGRITGGGVVFNVSDTTTTISKGMYESKIRAYEKDMSMYYSLMLWYVKNNNQHGCFDGSKLIDSGNCGTCGCEETSCGCNNQCEEDLELINDYDYGF